MFRSSFIVSWLNECPFAFSFGRIRTPDWLVGKRRFSRRVVSTEFTPPDKLTAGTQKWRFYGRWSSFFNWMIFGFQQLIFRCVLFFQGLVTGSYSGELIPAQETPMLRRFGWLWSFVSKHRSPIERCWSKRFQTYKSTIPYHDSQVLQSDLVWIHKWPFQGLNDLHLGNRKVSLKKLVMIFQNVQLTKCGANGLSRWKSIRLSKACTRAAHLIQILREKRKCPLITSHVFMSFHVRILNW